MAKAKAQPKPPLSAPPAKPQTPAKLKRSYPPKDVTDPRNYVATFCQLNNLKN